MGRWYRWDGGRCRALSLSPLPLTLAALNQGPCPASWSWSPARCDPAHPVRMPALDLRSRHLCVYCSQHVEQTEGFGMTDYRAELVLAYELQRKLRAELAEARQETRGVVVQTGAPPTGSSSRPSLLLSCDGNGSILSLDTTTAMRAITVTSDTLPDTWALLMPIRI